MRTAFTDASLSDQTFPPDGAALESWPVPGETREQKQLRLIAEVLDVLRAKSISYWLRGGWAVDFFLGEITRPHDDIDFFAWETDSENVVASLMGIGFEEVGGPPQTTQRNLKKEGEEVHIALLERTLDGNSSRLGDVGVLGWAAARALPCLRSGRTTCSTGRPVASVISSFLSSLRRLSFTPRRRRL
jgi:hypothetical protein